MKILMAGGGSGGHVTPLRAVIQELKKISADELDITLVTDRGFYKQTEFLFEDQNDIKLKKIFSGKFRRYNNKSLLWHITHLPTLLKNIRDVLYIVIGLMQSILLFIKNKPDVVFAKGGFVCVPVGLIARLFKVPLIIHDSDTHPGLTNRFLSKYAKKIATGMPTKYYSYPPNKTVYTGIPVSDVYSVVSEAEKAKASAHLGFDKTKKLLLISGGSTGALALNSVALQNAQKLLAGAWQIALITGKNKSKQAERFKNELSKEYKNSFKYYEFTELAPLVLAADVIVSRAGATAMQEFANAAKPVVIVPSPYLTGAHQLKNAQMFLEHNAGLVLQESELNQPEKFIQAVEEAASDSKIASALHGSFAKPHAARELAELILN